MANRNWMNGSKMFTNLTAPTLVNMQMTVDDSQDSGISNLMSNGYVKAVYMHSASGSPSSPNPAAGVIAIQLQDNYAGMINMMASIVSPVAGSEVAINGTLLTVGQVYEITTLGTSTLADWQRCGLPAGLTPALGMTFVAVNTGDGAGTGTGKVKVIGVSAINHIEIMGDPQAELGPQGVSNQGAWIYLQCLAPTINTGAYVAPMIKTAPAAGSIINISLLMDNSAVTVDGL